MSATSPLNSYGGGSGPGIGLVFEQTAWALSRLGASPPQEWLRLFLKCTYEGMPTFRCGEGGYVV